MSENPQYFHFTLGPVQGFVAQARRTRDFCGYRSHAPAWECCSDAPASRLATLERCLMRSHAGAWERCGYLDRFISVTPTGVPIL